MKITVHPEVLKLLGAGNDVEKFVNDVALIYLTGGFIRESQVVEKFTLDKVFKRRHEILESQFDEITHEFIGVVAVGKSDGQSLWVPSPSFCDAIEEHTDVLVMNSPRKRGISLKSGKDIELTKKIKN